MFCTTSPEIKVLSASSSSPLYGAPPYHNRRAVTPPPRFSFRCLSKVSSGGRSLTFASRNAQQKELLANVKLRPPDETFDKQRKLNLGGGVTARLLWYGGAHTRGDELTFVEPDRTLISGDVVQNKVVPKHLP